MEQMAAIGKVIKTHGVKGGLKVLVLSDYPDRVTQLQRVFLEKDGKSTSYNVEEAFLNGKFWVIYLSEITKIDDAQKLIGSLITIPLAERIKLPQNSYYLDQIIGLLVLTTTGRALGTIQDVLHTGSNDVYVVRPADSESPDILIPALKSVVKSIKMEQGQLEVELPEGLI